MSTHREIICKRPNKLFYIYTPSVRQEEDLEEDWWDDGETSTRRAPAGRGQLKRHRCGSNMLRSSSIYRTLRLHYDDDDKDGDGDGVGVGDGDGDGDGDDDDDDDDDDANDIPKNALSEHSGYD